MLDNHTLQLAIENGIINEDDIRLQVEMQERQHYLKMHTNRVWIGPDGKYYTYLPDPTAKRERRMIRRSDRESLDDAISAFYRDTVQEPTVSSVFYEWINKKLEYKEIEKQTYDRYEADYVRFFSKDSIRNVKVRHVTEALLDDFIRASIKKHRLSSKGWGNLRILIRGIFRYAKRCGYSTLSITHFMGDLDLSKNAFKKVSFTPETQVFKEDEIKLIRDYIGSKKPSLINLGILLAFDTGLRVGELSALMPKDICGNVLTIDKTEVHYKDENGKHIYDVRESTKGRDGSRTVVITDRTIKILKDIRKINPFGEYLFMVDGVRIKGKAFTTKLTRICKYVGITPRSAHKVRKTYATKLSNAGVDENLIIRQMGHTDFLTTKRFYIFDNRDDDEAASIIRSAIG